MVSGCMLGTALGWVALSVLIAPSSLAAEVTVWALSLSPPFSPLDRAMLPCRALSPRTLTD